LLQNKQMLAIRCNKRRGTQQEEDSFHQQSGLYLRNKRVKCYIGSIVFMVLKLGRFGKWSELRRKFWNGKGWIRSVGRNT